MRPTPVTQSARLKLSGLVSLGCVELADCASDTVGAIGEFANSTLAGLSETAIVRDRAGLW